jgi:hypothetical protein
MKKLLAVPAIAILAAAGAASAAGFAGGVSAGPLQTGQTNDLECAVSAHVQEWGMNDHTANPYVDTALVRLEGSQCEGQAVHIIALNPDGTQKSNYRGAAKVPSQSHGTQFVRIQLNNWPVGETEAVRISVDPGHSGIAAGGAS